MSPVATPYRLENFDGYCVVTLSPTLNDAQWAEIEAVGGELLDRLNGKPAPAFLVDLSALNYMGSAMLALIVRLWKSVKDRDGRMVVVAHDEMVVEVIKLAGLMKHWTVAESRDEALEALGLAGRPGPHGGSLAAALVAVAALLGAGVGLYLLLAAAEPAGDVRIPLGILFGCAAVALVLGTVAAVRHGGTARRIGIVVVLASLAVVIAGVFKVPAVASPGKVDDAAARPGNGTVALNQKPQNRASDYGARREH